MGLSKTRNPHPKERKKIIRTEKSTVPWFETMPFSAILAYADLDQLCSEGFNVLNINSLVTQRAFF